MTLPMTDLWTLLAILTYGGGGLIAMRLAGRAALKTASIASILPVGLSLAACAQLAFGPVPPASGGGASALVHFDALSAILLLMIALLGFVIVRFSRRYLDGDPEQPAFLGWLLLTLMAVSLLVTAGDLVLLLAGWVATSLTLHRLLVFRRERPKAILAARKKFIVARIGDVALTGAAVLMIAAFGTTSIPEIQAVAAALPPEGRELETGSAALLLVLAALLKSAQFPTHGWLTEVMETPTPVSALLHAGIVNAGGFLVIRFADVLVLAPGAMIVLALIGGFTALFGSVVMLTQTSVKVALAYSTVAQMGFMLLQCGLGAFSAAVLHIVAHSLYKAHAFLSSGRAVATVGRAPQGNERRSAWHALLAIAAASSLYALIAALFGGFAAKSPAILTLGAIFVAGLALYLAPLFTKLRVLPVGLGIAAAASLSYFVLQNGAAALLADAVPQPASTELWGYAVMALALLSFLLVAAAQAAPRLVPRALRERAWVHLSRGLYTNTLFSRLAGRQARASGANRKEIVR